MKKQNFLLIALFVMLSAASMAQAPINLSKDFAVTTGTPYPVVDGRNKEYFSNGKNIAISVKTQGEKVFIQRFDFTTMKEVSRKTYEDFPEYTKVQNVLQVGDKLFTSTMYS